MIKSLHVNRTAFNTRQLRLKVAAQASSSLPMDPGSFDYGFRARTARALAKRGISTETSQVPSSAIDLAKENFRREFESLRLSVRTDEASVIEKRLRTTNLLIKAAFAMNRVVFKGLVALDKALETNGALPKLDEEELKAYSDATPETLAMRDKLKQLTLSNEEVFKYEQARRDKEGEVKAPWYVRLPYDGLCLALDIVYNNRPIERFWCLEVVARLPYTAYISVLHLFESLGWMKAEELRKIHFAEEIGEAQHCAVCESLGGDALYFDRFIATHASIAYYFILVFLYLFNPKAAYLLSALIERHAADTYSYFVDANRDILSQLPAPKVALEYYGEGDIYYYEMRTDIEALNRKRPVINNLYDVFCAIRDDEMEHIKTMDACADGSIDEQIEARKAIKGQLN